MNVEIVMLILGLSLVGVPYLLAVTYSLYEWLVCGDSSSIEGVFLWHMAGGFFIGVLILAILFFGEVPNT